MVNKFIFVFVLLFGCIKKKACVGNDVQKQQCEEMRRQTHYMKMQFIIND